LKQEDTVSAVPSSGSFFAARSGVCVYVTVEGRAVRVCFPSLDADCHVETEQPANLSSIALAAAREAFQSQRTALLPLFDQVAEASLTEHEPTR
jgi:hypothetical protein